MGAVAVSGMETSLADFTGNFFVAVVAPKFFEGRMIALSRERVDKLHWSLALRATWSIGHRRHCHSKPVQTHKHDQADGECGQ